MLHWSQVATNVLYEWVRLSKLRFGNIVIETIAVVMLNIIIIKLFKGIHKRHVPVHRAYVT